MVFNLDLPNAPSRLGSLIEEIIAECPDAAVLVGTPLPLLNPGWMSRITDFNAALPALVSKIAATGKQVALVDTGRVNSSHIHQSDGIHPTDEAYALLAAAWYDGIVEAGQKKWIKKPLPAPQQQSQPSESSKPHANPLTPKKDDRLTLVSAWTPAQMVICAFLSLGLVITARRAISIFSRR